MAIRSLFRVHILLKVEHVYLVLKKFGACHALWFDIINRFLDIRFFFVDADTFVCIFYLDADTLVVGMFNTLFSSIWNGRKV